MNKGHKQKGERVNLRETGLILLLMFLTFFLRVYNTSDLSGGDDSQWAALAMYALQDPSLIVYPHLPDEPVVAGNMHVSRPFDVIPNVLSIILFGYTKFAMVFPAALFSALSLLVLYFLLKLFFDRTIAYLACFFFAVSPFQIAFSRIGLLHSSLTLSALLAFWFLIKGLKENKPSFIYLSAVFWFINITTTDIRGAVPVIAVLPCLYFYVMRKRFKFARLVKNRLFYYFLISYVGILVSYVTYISIPIMWGDRGWINNLFIEFSLAAGHLPNQYLSFFDAVNEMGSVIIFTPFMGLIFIFFLAGIFISIKNIKKFGHSFWLFYFIGILFFYIQGEFVPERQTIFMPAIATFAAIGLVVPYQHFKNNKKTYLLPILLAFSFSYCFFMFFMFSRLFPSEFAMISALTSMYGLSGLLSFLLVYWPVFVVVLFIFFISVFWLSKIRRYFSKVRSIYITLIAVLLIANLVVPFILVHGGVGVYKRTDSTSVVGRYLKQNLGNEKYSCVGGFESKALAFYTQRPCAFWVAVNVSWLEEQSSKGQLRYFIINTQYVEKSIGLGNVLPDGTLGPEIGNTEFNRNHLDKYDWLQQNTVDITKKTGLRNSDEYKVYLLKEDV